MTHAIERFARHIVPSKQGPHKRSFVRRCLITGVAGIALGVSTISQAATLRWRIDTPSFNTWYSASTYGQSSLISNTVINGLGFSNQGNPVSVSLQRLSNGRWIYTVTVYWVAPNQTCRAIARQNNSGVLRSTGSVYIGNPSGFYDLGTAWF
jgi:hypothetical protein